MKPTKISHFVLMGDSLSDRGTMYNRHLFGIIPMNGISGLKGRSPKGSFTNGYPWTSALGTMIADDFEIEELKTDDGLTPTDIADDLIDCDPRVETLVRRGYFLNDDRAIRYKGQDFVRSYDEGGLTAHDYSWSPSKSISRFFSRIILSTLGEKRHKLLADDYAHELSKKHKAETLVVEWSGANDLITVNERPSKEEVDKAIAARVENVKQLMKHGYRHFVLFNLPDLSLTPRYQRKSKSEQENASRWSKYFNDQLELARQELSTAYPSGSIEIFDVAKIYQEVYNDPAKFGFDPEKRGQPFTESKAFKNQTIVPGGVSPGQGYMSWDDVHPTAQMHELLTQRFYGHYKLEYNFQPPGEEAVKEDVQDLSTEEQLIAAFKLAYTKRLDKDRHGFFGSHRVSRIAVMEKDLSLEAILMHALYHGGDRSLAVMKDLHWFDAKGNLSLNNKVLKDSLERVQTVQEAHHAEMRGPV